MNKKIISADNFGPEQGNGLEIAQKILIELNNDDPGKRAEALAKIPKIVSPAAAYMVLTMGLLIDKPGVQKGLSIVIEYLTDAEIKGHLENCLKFVDLLKKENRDYEDYREIEKLARSLKDFTPFPAFAGMAVNVFKAGGALETIALELVDVELVPIQLFGKTIPVDRPGKRIRTLFNFS